MITTDPLFALLGRALDAASLRQAAYSANIANADVEGYQRLEVTFDPQEPALGLADESQTPIASPQLITNSGESVRLDHEMALMAKNAVNYQALLSAFERMTSLLQLASRDGREG